MTMKGSAFSADRLLAIAFVLMITFVLAGISAGETQASFTGTSTNPTNQALTMLVAAPASQNSTTSAAAGVVNLSWTATPTAPGTGHALSYDVLRGPVGGPYSFVGNTTSLAYSDTPASDGTYEYVIEAKITGGGTFTSGNSAAKSGISDRTAPSESITCNAVACSAGWYNATVSVTVSGTDAGTGMGSVTRNVDAGGQVSTGGASATFNVSGESAGHTVQYFTTDAAGNSSATGSQTIKIDLTAPTVATALTSASGAAGAPVTVDLTWTAGTDALSGVSGYEVRWTGNVAACPAANVANFPNSSTIGAVAAYSIPYAGAAGDKVCAYLVTIDNAGNRSANSAVTGPTKSK
jgi:hypothetical protein